MKTHTHGCMRCQKPVNDNHALCRVCRSSHVGGNNDNDPPGPGVVPGVSNGDEVTFSPAHRTEHLVAAL
jgi:hypothetical protein